MSRKALEWAQRLRAELVERIDELRTVLADIEPLRQELRRLEAQLEGVERLIAVYVSQIGVMERVPATPATLEPALPPVPVTTPPPPPPSLAEAARAFHLALRRETGRMISASGEWIGSRYISMRLWLLTMWRRWRTLRPLR